MKNIPHQSNDEDDWYMSTRDSKGYRTLAVNEIIIDESYERKLELYVECIRKKSIAPLEALSLFIPEFHFCTTGSRVFRLDDVFQGGIVYCAFDNKKPLYVGQTYMLRNRLIYHHQIYSLIHDEQVVVKGFFVPFDIDRMIFELYVINSLKPALNKQIRFY